MPGIGVKGLLAEPEARKLAERIISFVRADDATVSVDSERFSHLRFAANAFTTSGERENRSASVTVWLKTNEGMKRGAATTNDTDDASLRAAVEEAESLARISPVDREYVPTLGPQTYRPSAGFALQTAMVSAADRARKIGDIIARCEKAGVVGAGFHQSRAQAGGFATKNGNFGFQRSSLVSLSMTSRTRDGSASGYFLRNHYDVAKLDTDRIANESIRRALEAQNAREIEPGTYPVILEPQAVADLLSSFAFSFDARSAEEGRNAFAAPGGKTRLGEQFFDEKINVYSDPAHAELPGTPAAQGGLPAQQVYFVRGGKVENLVYSRFWATKQGRDATPGPVNTIIEATGPTRSVEEMMKSMKRGLLISRFWYIRSIDPRTQALTGLTRDGVWYVEDGRIKHAVKNLRFNQSIIRMLAPGNVEAVGPSERVGSSEGTNAALLPALQLKAFTFTSQSEAV
jgi:predicted Zn-dependent protease